MSLNLWHYNSVTGIISTNEEILFQAVAITDDVTGNHCHVFQEIICCLAEGDLLHGGLLAQEVASSYFPVFGIPLQQCDGVAAILRQNRELLS